MMDCSMMDEDMVILFNAASWNGIPAVQSLLEKSIDLNYVNFNGDNALNIAVANNHEEMVRFLVKHGAILNNPKTKISPLMLAIKFDYQDMTGVLIDLGANLEVGWFNEVKVPPLIFATTHLNYRIVRVLLQKGANPSAVEPLSKITALHEVGGMNLDHREPQIPTRLKIAKLLLRHGANLAAEDVRYRTALDQALTHSEELSKLFIKEGAAVRRGTGPDNELFFEYVLYAVNMNSPELVRLCLERGGDYSNQIFVNNSFITPYHLALEASTPEVVKVFWEFGCPNDLRVGLALNPFPGYMPMPMDWCTIRVSRGNSVVYDTQIDLMEGIKRNDLHKVLAAIENGAEPKGTSQSVRSPLHYLASTSKGDYEIAQVLLEHGVPVNKLDDSVKKICLFFALLNNNVNITKELLKFGVCFTKHDLETLKKVKNKEICEIMENITNAFKLTKRGSTKVLKRIKRFIKSGNTEMAKMMMNCVDWRGRTLMGLAFEKGHTKLAEEFMKIRVNHL